MQFAPVDQPPGVVAEVGDLPDTGVVSADVQVAQVPAPSPDALDRLYRPQALDVPVMVARDGPISTLDPKLDRTRLVAAVEPETTVDPARMSAMDAAVAEALGQAPATPQVLAADAPDVVMFAVRPSWVRVQAADGTVLFEKILDAGERFVLPKTEDAPLLRAGNAGSVYFAVNGEPYGPAGKGPSVVKNVALSVDKLKQAYPVADLSADKDLADFVAVAQNMVLPAPVPPPVE